MSCPPGRTDSPALFRARRGSKRRRFGGAETACATRDAVEGAAHLVSGGLVWQAAPVPEAAALAFHDWLRERGVAPADCSGLSQTIITECLPYERPRVAATAPAERLARAYVRLARYYRRSLAEGGSRHTRIAQYYVRDAVVPQTLRLSVDQYPEHVVPCAVLRDTAEAAFEGGASVRDVADWIQRRMVVAWIARSDARRLDGALGLKDRMPPGWNIASGCCYARLHAGGVAFLPPSSHPCTY